ncbi:MULTISPECIES: folylpolyglutamate synthase/dihydrofolate synthase family protein [unclassified Spirosoma]|uniref:bifunctional folylpolyglutamate synthase/dihydrofolate synthase n=1 Tax=unclassified Spirosoma TaxID=2621999 RepID=UPI000959E1C0|nr:MULTISPECIES: folylpolyglutamate synthase/dihydrofolate synthase family protein [unclassified Spirosoma]MBN8826521.1 bifunctional folylpolyglutamate synthase/dihydrofolate synthase [Spirosoma sp.]OJW71624.1 MAG: dihydrofolate synthase [Spirosoma sp. 48-14]
MQYTEAIDYLYSRLPVFHRIGPKAIKPGLGNTLALCEALGNPHQQFRSIHVGGTNGKGSTSHMLAAIYQSTGYRVGLYTSPHLQSFTERIRLNGQPIPEADVAAFVERYQGVIESIEPSFFEVTVAMAFDYFAHQQIDLAIIEVGLGGRLDSTNVITPLVSVITNIGYDHTDILGDTLPQIAGEKAGIIKPGVPVVIGETHPDTQAVFTKKALEQEAPLVFADQVYTVVDKGILKGYRQVAIRANTDEQPEFYELDLLGAYQLHNLPTALATISVLQSSFPVPVSSIRQALGAVSVLTGLKGRFQTIRQQPRVVADTAHNQPGLEALFETIHSLTYDTLRIVLGVVADKDRTKVLEVVPPSAVYYFCQAHTPRSLPAEVLQAEAAAVGRLGNAYADVNLALVAALEESSPNDLILITGSNYTIAELVDLG